MSFTTSQLNAMEWSPRVAAALSIPGSAWILYETLTEYFADRKNSSNSRRGGSNNNNSTPMQRALAGMSAVDILSSLAWFISTWAAPEDELGPFANGSGGAFGNQATCRVQGFLLQIAIGAPMYNGALILYYLLTIKYNYKTPDLLRLEPYLHAVIWIWCIGTSVVMWSLDLLHFIGPVCWIIDPPECWMDEIPDGVHCNRAKKYSTALFCIPLWITILTTIYALVEIYRTVRQVVKTMERRTTGGALQLQANSLRRSNRDLQAVALRAVLYSIAFCITWTSSTIWSVAQWFDFFPFWVSYMWTLMEPLQGFWNCCIFLYVRPDSRNRLLSKFSSASNLFRGSGSGDASGDTPASSSSFLRKQRNSAKNKSKRVSYKNATGGEKGEQNEHDLTHQDGDDDDHADTTNSMTGHSNSVDFIRPMPHHNNTTSTTSTTKTSEMMHDSEVKAISSVVEDSHSNGSEGFQSHGDADKDLEKDNEYVAIPEEAPASISQQEDSEARPEQAFNQNEAIKTEPLGKTE